MYDNTSKDGKTEDLTQETDLLKDKQESAESGENPDNADADGVGAAEQEADGETSKARMELYDWLQCVVSAIICGIFIFVFVGRTIGVDGRSMMDTLHNHDRVIMTNLFYTPKNGDIIVFHSPTESFGGTPLVKRVIATAGQSIDINFATSEVSVNGEVLDEPYINEPTRSRLDFPYIIDSDDEENRKRIDSGLPIIVPEGHVFVMGDNRNSSSDSRDRKVGMVDTRYILGKVLLIAIPGGDEYHPRDWSRIGLTR